MLRLCIKGVVRKTLEGRVEGGGEVWQLRSSDSPSEQYAAMGNSKRSDPYPEKDSGRERDSGFGGSESAKLLVEPEYECSCGCRFCSCGICEGDPTPEDDDDDTLREDPVQSLLDAATAGCLPKVRKLLSAGADANARSIGGCPVLTTVLVSPSVRRCPRRLPALAAALLAAGADPGRPEPLRAMTALHAAARLAAGYGPPAGTACGQTNIASRCVAFRCSSLRLLRLLTDTADASSINSQDHRKRTPLHVLATHGCLGAQPYEILLSRGADPTLRNYRDETPLLELLDRPGCGCSVPSGVEAVRLLADSTKTGPNGEKAITLQSRYRESPLHVAARRGSEAAVGLLLEAGADPFMVDLREDTPLHVAAARGHVQVAKMLLAAGSSVKTVNADGSTPLHLAVESGFVQVVEVLLQAPDCDPTARTAAGITPIDLAEQAFRQSSQPHLLALLQRHLETSVEDSLDTGLLDSISTDEISETDLSEVFDSSDPQENSTVNEPVEEHSTFASACASPVSLKSSFVGRLLRRSGSTRSEIVLCQNTRGSSEKLFGSHPKDLNSLLKKLRIP